MKAIERKLLKGGLENQAYITAVEMSHLLRIIDCANADILLQVSPSRLLAVAGDLEQLAKSIQYLQKEL